MTSPTKQYNLIRKSLKPKYRKMVDEYFNLLIEELFRVSALLDGSEQGSLQHRAYFCQKHCIIAALNHDLCDFRKGERSLDSIEPFPGDDRIPFKCILKTIRSTIDLVKHIIGVPNQYR